MVGWSATFARNNLILHFELLNFVQFSFTTIFRLVLDSPSALIIVR